MLAEPSSRNIHLLLALLDLKDRLGIDPELERAQELLYRNGKGIATEETLVELAGKLRLALSVFATTDSSSPDATKSLSEV